MCARLKYECNKVNKLHGMGYTRGYAHGVTDGVIHEGALHTAWIRGLTSWGLYRLYTRHYGYGVIHERVVHTACIIYYTHGMVIHEGLYTGRNE